MATSFSTMHIRLNRSLRTASYRDHTARLTRLEFDLLHFLVRNSGKICTRDEILDAIWGARRQYDTGTIDVHLNSIRRKLKFDLSYPIETFRGVGLCYHEEQDSRYYIFNLHALVADWVSSHEEEFRDNGLEVHIQLDPFVYEICEHPDKLRGFMDNSLQMLLPAGCPGYITVSSKLSTTHFSFEIDINGTVNILRIPVKPD